MCYINKQKDNCFQPISTPFGCAEMKRSRDYRKKTHAIVNELVFIDSQNDLNSAVDFMSI